MREYIVLSLILAIIAPSFAPWLPHDALHAVHDTHMAHHQSESYSDRSHHGHHNTHEHQHVDHDHHVNNEDSNHHPIQIDAISYFSDYLHIDLQQPDDVNLSTLDLGSEVFNRFATVSQFDLSTYLAAVQNRGPPVDFELRVKSTSPPVYLATQRFRV